MVVASLAFAASLQTLVSHPALYGWNWNYTLDPSDAVPPATLAMLDHDHDVAAWGGYDYNDVEIDDEPTPVLMAPQRTSGARRFFRGTAHASHQIVMRASTPAVLHEHVGDSGYLSPAPRPMPLSIYPRLRS